MTVVDTLSNTFRAMRIVSNDINLEFASLLREWDTMQEELRPTWPLPFPLISMVDGPSDPATSSWLDCLATIINDLPYSPLLGTFRRLSARHDDTKAFPHQGSNRKKNRHHHRTIGTEDGRGKRPRRIGPY